jgi:tetrahydromethanopterin S-methyltransferase subunit G
MSTEFWIGLIISLLVYGVSFGAFYGKVTTKLDTLEKKQDIHNGLIERIVVVEQSTKSAHHRLDTLEREVNE